MGGDEFALLAFGSDLPQSAHTLALRLVKSLSAPYIVRGCALSVGASVGIVVAAPGHNDVDALLRKADLALYRAKNEGRCTWRVFEPGDERDITKPAQSANAPSG